MTDNDDPAPPRDPRSADGLCTNDSRESGTRADQHRVIQWARSSAAGAHVAPTDPEVPRAKRRGAIRRQRSLVGLTAVVMGLLSITLAVLYRASQRVGMRDPSGFAGPLVDGTAASGAVAPPAIQQSTLTRQRLPPSVPTGSADDDAPADQGSTDSAPAGSTLSQPKGPPPATGIIRTPAF